MEDKKITKNEDQHTAIENDNNNFGGEGALLAGNNNNIPSNIIDS